MLDPLSALGLAGNVVQFVDFTSKLISESRKIYKDGAGTENRDLQLVTSDLVEFKEKLSRSALLDTDSESGDDLKRLMERCGELGCELLLVLRDLQASPNQKFESFRQAFRTVQKKGDIDSMQTRLDSIRDQLGLHLIKILGDQQSSTIKMLRRLETESKRHELEMSDQLMALKSEILESIQRQKQWMPSRIRDEHVLSGVDLSNISAKISLLVDEGAKLRVEQRILSSLRFRSIDTRHEKVADAHASTFEWIFDDQSGTRDVASADEARPRVFFKDWLLTGNGSYWVSGKPGSGKSTLMKFLTSHPRTLEALHHWAGDMKLVTASYFFWAAGTHLQKSQDGLLQTILYDIFRKCLDLMPVILASRWQVASSSSAELEPWTRVELLQAFDQLIAQTTSFKYCLFIDGLDEYSGDHSEIVSLMQRMASSGTIKLCLSSRPFNIFKDAFGSVDARKLSLQDLTHDDIKRYSREKLEANSHFRALKSRDPRCQDLVSEIAERAQGVFLWVFLVVRDLLEGLTNSDRLSDLQRRLRRLPVDLEKYFRHILNSIEDFYSTQTAEAFYLCLKANEPPLLVAFSILDEDDPDYAFNLQIQRSIDQDDIVDRYESMIRRLSARCKGLLEVSGTPNGDALTCEFTCQVEFLHRTVRDFLETPAMKEWLNSRIPEQFSPYYELARAYLGSAKLQLSTLLRYFPWGMIDDCLRYAHRAEIEYQQDLTRIFTSVLSTLRKGFDQRVEGPLLLRYALEKGIHSHIRHVAGTRANRVRETRKELGCSPLAYSLLDHKNVLKFSRNADRVGPPVTPSVHLWSPELVRVLLELGEDVNEKFGDSTIWGHFLQMIWDSREMAPESQMKAWFLITKCLIRSGADAKLTITVNSSRKTVLETVSEVFESKLTEKHLAMVDSMKAKPEASKDRSRLSIWFKRIRHRKSLADT